MTHKTLLSLICCLPALYFNGQGIKKAPSVTIKNNSLFTYTYKVISIPWSQLSEKYAGIDTTYLKIIDAQSKKEVPYQLEYAGNKEIENLLVQVSLKPKSAIKLLLQGQKHGAFVTQTYGRFVPERKGDFAWENDKIAFRMYGKELELTPAENGYGMDVWVKRTARMIINERYKKADYHVDHGDGLDYYSVGLTLGAGNMAPYVGDSIWYSKNFTSYKVLDNGPLRTTFQLRYDVWDVAGKSVSCVKTISLDAGTQLNKVTVEYRYNTNDNLPVAAGIVKRKEAGVMLLDEEKGIAGYWEPQHGADGTTGIGILMPSGVKGMKVTNQQILVLAEMKKGVPLVYYTGAVWDKGGSIRNSQEWFSYLEKERHNLINDGIRIEL